MNIASVIDHRFLNPTARISDMEKLCIEAKENGFRAICIPPLFVKKAKELLKDNTIKIATVTGFPFGYSAIEAKLAETVLAIVDGADEIDMVINIAALKNADWQWLAKEINTILPVVKSKGRAMKVILETGILNNTEITTCCDIYGAAGVDFVTTSTGFNGKGANVETVRSLRAQLADTVKICAAGGIDNYSFAKQLLDAGAYCISPENSIDIVKEETVLN